MSTYKKRIEYRALREIDDGLPEHIMSYAKEDMRLHILNDLDYQQEVLRYIHPLREWVESQIKEQDEFLERTKKISFVDALFRLQQIQAERITAVIVKSRMEWILDQITYTEKVLNSQLESNHQKRAGKKVAELFTEKDN